MYSFRELQKAKKITIDGSCTKLAIMGNCSTQFLSDAIEGMAKLESLNLQIQDTDYNQIDTQLIDPSSETYKYNPDIILIWLCCEKLYEDFLDMDLSDRDSFADVYIDKIKKYWSLIAKNSNSQIMQINFTEIEDLVLGQYSCKVDSTFVYQVRKLNYYLEEAAKDNGKVYIIDSLSLQIQLGKDFYFDSVLYYNAKMPVSLKALPYLTNRIVQSIKAIKGIIKKCIILDLDNTLWGGVIGDDGLGGIEIGELGKGHVYSNLQRWFKQLKEYGIILAICSKNNEDIAKEPFIKHDEMILKLSDISLFVANWNDKATNIKLIQESLNIGMDSIVFIDDNPFERELVKQKYPSIEVPDLPEDVSLWLDYLQKQNYFETASYSGVGSDRTKLYQAEFERKQMEVDFETIDDYLKDLEMIAFVKPFEKDRFSRIAQLTQRSNQFNLRTIRYTEDEIQRLSEDDNFITLYYTLEDRIGEYGLISVAILKKETEKELFIDTWLMSCRVLKRGMEEFIMNNIVKTAEVNGYETIRAEYIPTKKNKMVENIYEQFGFERINDNQFELRIEEYKPLKTFVQEEK